MEEAEEMLGMPYTLVGSGGAWQIISDIPWDFQTVNLLPPAGKLLPPNGVYYAAVRHNGKVYKAISNVGTKPTVSSEKVMGVESYLYDFDQDIYGQEIEVALKSFRRPERRFGSLEELKEAVGPGYCGWSKMRRKTAVYANTVEISVKICKEK